MEIRKEYNLRYLLAEVRTNEEKRRTGSDTRRTNATKRCRTSSDIGA
jgi:hypothetical protein